MLRADAFYYLNQRGERRGPVNMDVLVDMLRDGVLSSDSPVWTAAFGDEWMSLEAASADPALASSRTGGNAAASAGATLLPPPAPGLVQPPAQPSIFSLAIADEHFARTHSASGGANASPRGSSERRSTKQREARIRQLELKQKARVHDLVAKLERLGDVLTVEARHAGVPADLATAGGGGGGVLAWLTGGGSYGAQSAAARAHARSLPPMPPPRRLPPAAQPAPLVPPRSAECGQLARRARRWLVPSFHWMRAMPIVARNLCVAAGLLMIWAGLLSLVLYSCASGASAFGIGGALLAHEYVLALQLGPRTAKEASAALQRAEERSAQRAERRRDSRSACMRAERAGALCGCCVRTAQRFGPVGTAVQRRAPLPLHLLGWSQWVPAHALALAQRPLIASSAHATPPPSESGASERSSTAAPPPRGARWSALCARGAARARAALGTQHYGPPPPVVWSKTVVRSFVQWPIKAGGLAAASYWLSLDECALPYAFALCGTALAGAACVVATFAHKPDLGLWALTRATRVRPVPSVPRALEPVADDAEAAAPTCAAAPDARLGTKADRRAGGGGCAAGRYAAVSVSAPDERADAHASADADGISVASSAAGASSGAAGARAARTEQRATLRATLRTAARGAASHATALTAGAAREWYGAQVRADTFPRRFWLGAYVLLSAALFGEAVWRHARTGVGRTSYYAAAKGFGQLLNLNCMLLLLPVLRSLGSALHSAAAYLPLSCSRLVPRLIPLDKNVAAHRAIARHAVVICTVAHATCHWANYAYASTYFRAGSWPTGRAEVMAYSPSLWYGFSGHVLLAILIVLVAAASESVRRAHYETFWLAHHLFVPFYALLLGHGEHFWRWGAISFALYLAERLWRAFARGRRLVALHSVLWFYAEAGPPAQTHGAAQRASEREPSGMAPIGAGASAPAQRSGAKSGGGGGGGGSAPPPGGVAAGAAPRSHAASAAARAGGWARLFGWADFASTPHAALVDEAALRAAGTARAPSREPAVFTLRFDNRRGVGGNQARSAMDFLEGQYLYLCCPHVSSWEWHPFTIASAPQDDYLEVNIRVVPDRASWTWRVCEYLTLLNPKGLPTLTLTTRANSADGTPQEGKVIGPDGRPFFRVDGPHGAPSQAFLTYRQVLCVGAGIGVTPLASILAGTVMHRWLLGFQPFHIHFVWVARREDVSAFKWLLLRLPHFKARQLAHNGSYALSPQHKAQIVARRLALDDEREQLEARAPPTPALHKACGKMDAIGERISRISGRAAHAPVDPLAARLAELEAESRELAREEEAAAEGSRTLDITLYLTGTTAEALRTEARGDVSDVLRQLQSVTDEHGEPYVRVHAGRPRWGHEFARVKHAFEGERVGVIFCGAPAIGEQLAEACAEHSDERTGTLFRLHSENF